MLVTNSDQKTCISPKFYTSLLIIKVIKEESFGKLDFQIVMFVCYSLPYIILKTKYKIEFCNFINVV